MKKKKKNMKNVDQIIQRKSVVKYYACGCYLILRDIHLFILNLNASKCNFYWINYESFESTLKFYLKIAISLHWNFPTKQYISYFVVVVEMIADKQNPIDFK